MSQIEFVLSVIGRWLQARRKPTVTALCLVLVLVVGLADYLTDVRVSFSVLYLVPIAISAWYATITTAFALAVISTIAWVLGDLSAGLYSGYLLPLLNAVQRVLLYAITIALVDRLHHLQLHLGDLVHQRTRALTMEVAERERLEQDLLKLSERERRTIGENLHDGLCQHLAGTALAGQVLSQKLASQNRAEAADSRRIVDLVEEGIKLARGIAKGLHPVDMAIDGLVPALEEFASATSELYRISCRVECESPVSIGSSEVATHLYRIVQEAVSNAARHGRASEISISLGNSAQGMYLSIRDNGIGLPDPTPVSGMGLRIMANRAKVIGAKFAARRLGTGGTEVLCVLSEEAAKAGPHVYPA